MNNGDYLRPSVGEISKFVILINFDTMLHFYTPGKRQKNFDFLMISRGVVVEHYAKLD